MRSLKKILLEKLLSSPPCLAVVVVNLLLAGIKLALHFQLLVQRMAV